MEKEEKMDKKEFVKEGLKAIGELEEALKLENIIKDNKIEFKSNEKTFRIRKPSFIEQEELGKIRRKKYIEFCKDDSYLFRKQWEKIYQDKGIDIKKMDNEIKKIQSQVESLLLRLAKTVDLKSIEKLKDEILKLRDKQYSLSIEKTDLLSNSIEDQILIFVNSYTTYLILEEKIDDKWTRHFKKYEDFIMSNDSDLVSKAVYYINYLIYQKPLEDVKKK